MPLHTHSCKAHVYAQIVPGRVSTEIDARLSFDTEATVRKGKELMELYKAAGVSTDRVLVRVSACYARQ